MEGIYSIQDSIGTESIANNPDKRIRSAELQKREVASIIHDLKNFVSLST
jgi:hypothetical protein